MWGGKQNDSAGLAFVLATKELAPLLDPILSTQGLRDKKSQVIPTLSLS